MKAAREGAESLGSWADILLIHTPGDPNRTAPCGSWKQCRLEQYVALQQAVDAGFARSVGVSNFDDTHLAELKEAGLPPPRVNEIEMHPLCPVHPSVQTAMADQSISTIAFGSLGGTSAGSRGEAVGRRLRTLPAVQQAAREKNRTVQQILLRFGIERGAVVIPATRKLRRMRENLDLFDFALTDAEVTSALRTAVEKCAAERPAKTA